MIENLTTYLREIIAFWTSSWIAFIIPIRSKIAFIFFFSFTLQLRYVKNYAKEGFHTDQASGCGLGGVGGWKTYGYRMP